MSDSATEKATGRYRFLSGNEACAEGALAAGCRFFAGYPISPSSEVAEFMSARLPRLGGRFIQMEDEIASIGAILGAALTGQKTMTATSGPGLSLMQENLGFGMMAEIPCVVLDVMRGGPSTGNPTGPSQSDVMAIRWGTHGDHPVIALCPATIHEVFHLTVESFNFAEMMRTPVVLAIDEITAHMREKIELPDPSRLNVVDRRKPKLAPGEPYFPYDPGPDLVPAMANYGEGYRYHMTGLNHDNTGFPTGNAELMEAGNRRLLDKIEANKDKLLRYETYRTEDAEILIVAYGSSARSARRAVDDAREKGVKVGLFRVITLYPIPDEAIRQAASKVRRVIVPEMNLGQYVMVVQRVLGHAVPVSGIHQVNGEPIQPSRILAHILGE
jgi:2-oxoglutarate ferredoxin oxidoreductase subunit alpha